MARKKEYVEEEVAEKAMQLFWKKGYEVTSMRDLEKHLGINQFSIYASFKSKQGLLWEAIAVYERQIWDELLKDLENSAGDPKDIKVFFHKFLDFVQNEERMGKGCFMINTIQELDAKDITVKKEIIRFTEGIKNRFNNVLAKAASKGYLEPEIEVDKYSNYLLGILQGLSTASKHFSRAELNDFIEISLKNLEYRC